MDIYGSGMMELDKQVGRLLDELEALGIAKKTIVSHGRQRCHGAMVAGRRHHALPRREGNDVGRRRSRSDAGSLAGKDSRGQGLQWDPRQHRPFHNVGRRGRYSQCR